MKFAEFMGMSAVDEVLTEEVLTILEGLEPLKNQEVTVVGQLESGDIGKAIYAAHPELKRQSIAIANAVLRRLDEAGYCAKIVASTPGSFPSEISIKIPETIEQMGLKKLIETVATDPDRRVEAWQRLIQMPEVVGALKRSTGLAWVVNGTLDITRTVEYIQNRNDPFTKEQYPDREKGERLLALGEALGIETRCYVHPLDGSLLRGKDEFQIDWTKELDPESHKAALWALKSQNKLHPGCSYGAAQSLLKGESGWGLLMAAYWAAIDRNDPLATGIRIYQDPPTISAQTLREPIRDGGTPRSATRSGHGSEIADESYYEQMVRDLSLGDETIKTYGRTIKAGIYDNIFVGSYSTYFEPGVVVLGSCTIGSYSVTGQVILAPKKRVSIQSYGVEIEERRCKSWHEVATLAGLI